jgi:peptidoglycan/LPS O-acetylase OafA/YrhL
MTLQNDRHNNFNLLRFVFAMLVVIAHAPQITDGNRDREPLFRLTQSMDLGQVAVDFFFILSGFLIVQSWKNAPDAAFFLEKRVRRIFPGFLVASLFCAVVVGPLLAPGVGRYFANFNVPDFLVAAFTLQKPVTPPLFTGSHHQLNGSMWTIAPEFACYLSVIALGLIGAVKNRHCWGAIAIIVIAAYIAQRFGIALSMPDFMLRLGACFAIGGCYFLYADKIRLNGKIAAAAGLLLAGCMFSWRLSEIAVVFAGSYILFYLGQKKSPRTLAFNSLPDVSYGVYLYSFPIQTLIAWHFTAISPWVLLPISAALSIVAGTVSWYLIEKPLLRLGRPKAERAIATT